jgi:hypothetical protein
MKVGDIVRHVKTGDVALVTQLWDKGHNRGVVEVVHKGSLVRWFRTSTKPVN